MRQGTGLTTGIVNGLVTTNRTHIVYAEATGTGTAVVYDGQSAVAGKEILQIEAPCKVSLDPAARAVNGVFVVNGGASVILHLG